MKVIFLDIDGVLNTNRTLYAFPGEYNKRFDPVAVGLLNDLIEDSGAKVVVSSTWRILDGKRKELPGILKEAGFKYDIYAWTGQKQICRGYEIKAYMEGLPITHYCIIDDDSDMLLEQMPHFVQCPYGEGLTFKNYKDAQRILDIWS